jgi:transketolase
MMLLGEAFAALGYNTWTSTFCPFWDWKVLRRIAVGYQERMESIQSPNGWLSPGHGLDLTMLATASNFETRTNGATHMANDDALVFDAIAHLKIIDVSCPRQLLSIMQWIMEGNRGLVYLRVMRTPSAVLYDSGYAFEFGRGAILREGGRAVIVSSGRGVHEALAAADLFPGLAVADMPSVDEDLLLSLYDSGRLMIFAEQNNGYIWQNFLKTICRRRAQLCDARRVVTVNTLSPDGHAHFIHSATYEELIEVYGLSGAKLAATVEQLLEKGRR